MKRQNSTASAESPRRPLEAAERSPALGAAVGLAFAFLGTLIHVTDAPLFRADRAVLSVTGHGTGLFGLPSAWASQAFAFLPLGTQLLRTCLLGAVAAGVAGAALVVLTGRLGRSGAQGRVDRALGVAAALAVVLGLPWLSDSTTPGGGAAPAAALAIVLLTWARSGARTGVAFWALLGVLGAESPWAAALLGLALVAERPLPASRRALAVRAAAFAAALATCVLPRALSMSRPELEGAAFFPPGSHVMPLDPWSYVQELGVFVPIGVLLALLGGRIGWRVLIGTLVIVMGDFLLPGVPSSSWMDAIDVSPARSALHLFALASLAPPAALGVAGIATITAKLELPGAAASRGVVTVLALAAAVAGIEDASRVLSRTEPAGARAFTHEALDVLPARAVVLTHSVELGRRLDAAQAAGHRPDVLVVPESALGRADRVGEWLRREPHLDLFIRDVSLGHGPSEHALSRLTDVRPVYVEPSARWSRRLLEHLAPDVPLARVSRAALTRGERKLALELAEARSARITAAARTGLYPDLATIEMLRRTRERLGGVLGRLGEQKAIESFLAGSRGANNEDTLAFGAVPTLDAAD